MTPRESSATHGFLRFRGLSCFGAIDAFALLENFTMRTSRVTPEEIFQRAKAAAKEHQDDEGKARDLRTARLKALRLARDAEQGNG